MLATIEVEYITTTIFLIKLWVILGLKLTFYVKSIDDADIISTYLEIGIQDVINRLISHINLT